MIQINNNPAFMFRANTVDGKTHPRFAFASKNYKYITPFEAPIYKQAGDKLTTGIYFPNQSVSVESNTQGSFNGTTYYALFPAITETNFGYFHKWNYNSSTTQDSDIVKYKGTPETKGVVFQNSSVVQPGDVIHYGMILDASTNLDKDGNLYRVCIKGTGGYDAFDPSNLNDPAYRVLDIDVTNTLKNNRITNFSTNVNQHVYYLTGAFTANMEANVVTMYTPPMFFTNSQSMRNNINYEFMYMYLEH